jgi:WD40 repeat protein
MDGHAGSVNSARFHPAEPAAYSAGADNMVRRWDITTGALAHEFEEQGGTIESVAVSPDGALVATGGWTIGLWTPTGAALGNFGSQLAAVFELAWFPDAHGLAAACSDQQVRVWDVARAAVAGEFGGFNGAVTGLALSADGRLMVASGVPVWRNESQVALFNLDTGERKSVFEGHSAKVNSVAISADGQLVLTGSADNTVRLWDAATGECLRVLAEELTNVQQVRFSHNAGYAVAGTGDGLVQTWFLDWTLKEMAPAAWDEGAARYLDAFIAARRPVGDLPEGRVPDPEMLAKLLRRKGSPEWDAEAFERLLYQLGCVGYGWLTPRGVEDELRRRSRQSAVMRWFGSRRSGRT